MTTTDWLIVALICINAIEVAVLVGWIYRRTRQAHIESVELLLAVEEEARSVRHALKNLTAALRLRRQGGLP